MTSILIVEDDTALNNQLSGLLRGQGYYTEQRFDGEQGLTSAVKGLFDLIVLDVMLPKLDGISLLEKLRETHKTPVIMVTAKGAEEERILGFQQGADDYVAKPFNSKELLLRIEALLRRSLNPLCSQAVYRYELDGLVLDSLTQEVKSHNKQLDLTPMQFALLQALLSQKGEVLSKPFLYQSVLKKSYGVHDRSLDMHLSRVRRKLDAAGWQGNRLHTVHGKGYCLA